MLFLMEGLFPCNLKQLFLLLWIVGVDFSIHIQIEDFSVVTIETLYPIPYYFKCLIVDCENQTVDIF